MTDTIEWFPIVELPDDMKDGRQILCLTTEYWNGPRPLPFTVTVMRYDAWDEPSEDLKTTIQQSLEGYYDGTSPQPHFYSDTLNRCIYAKAYE